ncbi:MAG: alpha/beta fold hydrolase [Vicinamibacterales bacterium]
MANALSSDIRIHYEVVGSGPPIVLVHGFTQTLSQWRRQGVVDALVADYQLILIDARGHGKSDKPDDVTAYTNALMTSDVIAVLDDLGIDRAHYCGYSMGGRIGFGVEGHYPDRLHSLIVGVANPDPLPEDLLAWFIAGFEQGTAAFMAQLESGGRQFPDGFREDVLANDPRAMVAMLEAWKTDPGDVALLPRMTMPSLIFAGDQDVTNNHDLSRDAAQRMPNATFLSLEGQGHIIPSDLWLPHVQNFLQAAQRATVSRATSYTVSR